MFVLALAHGLFSLFQFHALGNLNPLVSLFVSNTSYASLADFPFQALGFFALLILFLMAATSHDFWLHNLTAPVWKRLHMLVYVAYGLLIAHVTLGALQSETSPLLAAVLGAGLTVGHRAASVRGGRRATQRSGTRCGHDDGYVPVCDVDSIPEKRACVVSCGGERVAVFKYDGRISARLQRLPAPERAARRRQDHRRMHHVSVARLSVPARFRGISAAVHRKSPDLPHARGRQPGVSPSVAAASRHARRTVGDPEHDTASPEFYVGYLPIPRGLKKIVRARSRRLGAVAVATAAILIVRPASLREQHLRIPAVS